MYDLNVTMIAFHGKAKPVTLKELISDVLGSIAANLPPSTAWAFQSYEFDAIHATVLGMEVDVVDGRVVSRWWRKNRNQERTPDIDLLQDRVKAYVSDNRVFTVRFGGFPEAHCKCADERIDALCEWECPTGYASEFHSCDRSTYDGSFYAYSPGPVVLTGWPVEVSCNIPEFSHLLYKFRKSTEDAGLLDKYHSDEKPHWKDDDCFIRIGTFTSPIPDAQLTATQKAIRNYLSRKKPVTVEITVNDVAIVYYDSPSMEEKHIRDKIPLTDFLKDTSSVKKFYKEIQSQATS